MGHLPSHEALALRWAELCNDRTLHDLPYKIELNAYGTIEMSPAGTRHARLQARLAAELSRQLTGGDVLTEVPVATEIGVRVPDVAWASDAFLTQHGDSTPFPAAPEICVEIRSPSNSEEEMALKTRAYLAAGAVEVWIVTESGALQVFDAAGDQAASRWGVRLTLPPPAPR